MSSLNIRSTKKRVESLLIAHERLRDSDRKLIATIWHNDAGLDQGEAMSAFEFLKKYAAGSLTSAETIRRSRQQIQEENAGLRGKSYKARKTKKVEEAHKELGYK